MSDDEESDSERESIKYLKVKRKYVRGDATRISSKIETDLPTLSTEDKSRLVCRIEKVSADLEKLNEKIFTGLYKEKTSEELIQAEYDTCADYDETLASCLNKLRHIIPVVEDGSPQPPRGGENNRTSLKLPHVPLPEYSHRDGEDLQKFLTNFENVIEKYRLSSYEKYVYLQRQLSNEPLTLIKSLEMGRQNYEDAKDLLQQAFASTTTLQYRVIKQLAELKMSRGEDPYEYISKMRMITESFLALNVDANIVLQYFFWNGMNEDMQHQFIHITNTNRPNLEEIKKFTFEAAERYTSLKKIKGNRDTALVSAATVNRGRNELHTQSSFCNWCTGAAGPKVYSHKSRECRKYSTAREKRALLANQNGCFKCGNFKHQTKNCDVNFRQKCTQCQKYHYQYLCLNTGKTDGSSQDDKKKIVESNEKSKDSTKVQSGSVFIGKVNIEQYGEDAIIPTFSVECANKHVIKCMRDSGCQPNLITQKCAKKLKLKIISDEFPLNINGFNQSVKHIVKVVEIELNPHCPPVRALCVPTINVRLKLPGLCSVAHEFEHRGYKLADSTLVTSKDEIKDLDFVLGNNDAQIFPQTEVVFGTDAKSVYSHTPIGIMLMGSVSRMRKNLSYLSDYTESAKCECLSFGIEPATSTSATMDADFDRHPVYDKQGNIDEKMLDAAAESILKQSYFEANQYFPSVNDSVNEADAKLSQYVLNKTTRNEDGRLVMPLLWRGEVSHLLASNYNLALQILRSNLKRLQGNPVRLQMYDSVIKEQVGMGIVEQIPNLKQFLTENPTASFLPHMGVFRMSNETTKCRIVYLSNLAEKLASCSISHNQAMLSGPNLNRKITTAILKMRFDEYILCFDLQKAFLCIALSEIDQNRLLFLWFKNVEKNDFSIVAYRSARLPFGLRCSPALLMLGLYKILIEDSMSDPEPIKIKKRLIYDLIYMDNGCITAKNREDLSECRELLKQTFEQYQFYLQQFVTNSQVLQLELDEDCQVETPKQVKLLGLRYDREDDVISTDPLHLDGEANTRRKVLSSLASNFDLFQFQGPVLNRARLFVHKLQCDSELGWDAILSETRNKEWQCISNQVNASEPVRIKRCVGNRDSSYRLIAFTDASKLMIGTVIYIQEINTLEVNFLLAKNRIVNKQLELKSIPALELQAVSFGLETLIDTQKELNAESSIVPINITELKLFCDSMVSLNWINKYVNRLDKTQKYSIFVQNRLEGIRRQCESVSVIFSFIAGQENPADVVTRPVSYKQLLKTNYHTGPAFLSGGGAEMDDGLTFRVPNPLSRPPAEASALQTALNAPAAGGGGGGTRWLVPLSRYSSFYTLLRVWRNVLYYIQAIKRNVAMKKSPEVKTDVVGISENQFNVAKKQIIRAEQSEHFPEVFQYFSGAQRASVMPNIVSQLNVFLDGDGILRVRGKFKNSPVSMQYFPILLPRAGELVNLIVKDYHERMMHAGVYSILAQIKKQFYVAKFFITVKKILNECIHCRKQNARTIKINQSHYRDFRESPASIPYRNIFLDHFGPFLVKQGSEKVKVWILCITCLWSRSINLKICLDLSVTEFLRAFQIHICEYGMPERVFSDMGTQLIAGANIISDYFKDVSMQLYLHENNIQTPSFQQYYKGRKELGSLVETCVKISKRAMYGALGKNVIPQRHFELLVAQAIKVINKRPVAFRDCLRSDSIVTPEVPLPITPELLTKGYELPTLCVIPSNPLDEEWKDGKKQEDSIKVNFSQLSQCRERLIKIYQDEFLSNLMQQAIDRKDRFKPVSHKKLKLNDIVLMKEDNTKRVNFPLGIVKSLIGNELGEVTAVTVKKGKTGEILKRHVSSLIPVLSTVSISDEEYKEAEPKRNSSPRKRRKAAILSEQKTKKLFDDLN